MRGPRFLVGALRPVWWSKPPSPLIIPNFVFLYTLQAIIFVRTMLGVAHIERIGMGTDVSNIITTVTRFDTS